MRQPIRVPRQRLRILRHGMVVQMSRVKLMGHRAGGLKSEVRGLRSEGRISRPEAGWFEVRAGSRKRLRLTRRGGKGRGTDGLFSGGDRRGGGGGRAGLLGKEKAAHAFARAAEVPGSAGVPPAGCCPVSVLGKLAGGTPALPGRASQVRVSPASRRRLSNL
jgi:hypothetical protein